MSPVMFVFMRMYSASQQLARPLATSSQPTHLPNLITPHNFLPAAPQNASPGNSATPPAPPKQPHHPPPLSATIPPPPSPTPLSPSACFSNDHFAGTGSPPSGSHISKSVTAATSDSTASSPDSTAVSSGPSSASPTGLQLCVDLSSYPLQQLPSSDPSALRSAARQHPMVLRLRLPKTTLLAASAAASTAPNCWLHKSLYGLKQAPRAWYTRLSDFLISISFTASKVDTFLFILFIGADIFYLLIYVDDILLTGSNSTMLHRLIQLLSSEFKLHDLGAVHCF